MRAPDRSRGWIPAAAWPSLIMLGMLGLGLYVRARGVPGPAGGRGPMLPRIPAPAADLPTLLRALGVGSTVWFFVVVVLPALVWASRRLEPDRLGWRRTMAIVALAVVLLALASAVAQFLVVYHGTSVAPPLKAVLQVEAPKHLVTWTAVGGILALFEGRRRTLHSALERERLRGELAEQRLLTLTAQLQPHFLFNTLQGISTLIHRDPEAADEVLGMLSDLLRDVLRHRDQPLVSLGEELRFTRTYLEITRTRFADRFAYTLEIPDELHGLAVPLFLLQPLIENAVQHGIGERIEGGRVAIRGWAEGGRLVLEVEDDGARPGTAAGREGIGLANTRARLAAAFGTGAGLSLAVGSGGAVARVELPRRPLPVAP